MADPVIPVHRLSCGDEYFDLSGLMSQEMAQVKSWTQLPNRQAFYDALRTEDPDAVNAAFCLARRRAGQKDCRFSSVDVNTDDLRWSRLVDGRTVELVFDTDDAGDPLIVQVDGKGTPLRDGGGGFLLPTGADGEQTGLAVHFDDDGNLRWRYVDSGEDVRPTSPPATSGSTGSPPTETTPTSGSDSDSGTPTTSDT